MLRDILRKAGYLQSVGNMLQNSTVANPNGNSSCDDDRDFHTDRFIRPHSLQVEMNGLRGHRIELNVPQYTASLAFAIKLQANQVRVGCEDERFQTFLGDGNWNVLLPVDIKYSGHLSLTTQ